jgi:Ca-activated chloride channel homolog
MIEILRPWMLALLVALPLLWLGMRGSIADWTPAQRRACLALRALILVLIVLALAGVRMLRPSSETSVLFVVDSSSSISPQAAASAREFVAQALASKSGGDTAGVIGFAEKPELWQPPVEYPQQLEWPAMERKKSTDIGAALGFASALFPSDQAQRIVLLSDGNDTASGATEASARLAASGVEVWTVPLKNPEAPEVLVERVEIPRRLKQGEPFDLVANIRSSVATSAKVKLFQSQFLVAERSMDLKVGDNEFRAPGLTPDGNFVPFEVEVSPAQDTAPENNRASAVASLRGQPKVLLVDGDSEKARPLADSLRNAQISVDLRDGRGAPKSIDDLQQFDLFILSDLSALGLSRAQMDLYRRWVQDFGGGFLMLGGESSFGVGGYFRSPVEQMLPVRMEHSDRQELPTVALLIVLDRSGSMTAQVAGQTKMALANQGAALALNVLGVRDYFGVLAVDTRAHVVAALARHTAREPVAQKILSITAGGGGIYIYTSLAESFQALRDVSARIKHVILFSDAADAEEKNAGEQQDGSKGSGTSLDLVASMASAKITTSVVALGTEADKDTGFLRQLAERGQGRFYLTSDATTLPQIFSTETMKVAQSSLVEEPTLAVPLVKSPLIAGIDWAQSPLLLGYNATKPKPTAEVLLATERGEPLLATWRYGLGQTAVFTSDAKARWAGEWLAWPGYGKFWPQVVRGLLRKSDAAAFEVATRENGDALELQIDAVTQDGNFRNRLPVTISARGDSGESSRYTAVQEAPGRYRASIPLPNEGTTVLSVNSPELPDGGIAMAHSRSYPREFLTTSTNVALLDEIALQTGGRFDPKAADVFARSERQKPRRKDLGDYFLIVALSLLPLDIFLRRRTWR